MQEWLLFSGSDARVDDSSGGVYPPRVGVVEVETHGPRPLAAPRLTQRLRVVIPTCRVVNPSFRVVNLTFRFVHPPVDSAASIRRIGGAWHGPTVSRLKNSGLTCKNL